MSTKYFLFGIRPRTTCLFLNPVHANALPRFESVGIIIWRKKQFFLLKSKMEEITIGEVFTDIHNFASRSHKVVIQRFQMRTKHFW